ncbi:hypothetical protein G8E00_07085 [Acinetobacter shaoyimingii]|uniref:Iron transporter n=2 Tax=Acinetobacter shaoyimingii TaxID=2715164 RepID=A0A6G8S0F4_9GAMM|nr:hypothetical protein [Acinetobacter shaoyimingii]QIO07463.1 hypothetical protein G8E00_07085 [Acinetobacter shaoyimingii]
MHLHTIRYPLAILYRVLIAFLMGYLCTYFFTLNATAMLKWVLPKAESVFLAAFIAIFFFVFFVLMSFSIHTLKKLSVVCLSFLLCLFLLSKWVL